MDRYQHLLRRVTGDAQPRQWCVLEVDWSSAVVGRLERLSLSRWYAVGWSGQGGVYGPDVVREGTDQGSFWRALACRLARPGPIWVVGCRVLRAMALLGLWERLEDGRVWLAGEDHRDRSVSGESRVPGVWRGDGDDGQPAGDHSRVGVRPLRRVPGPRGAVHQAGGGRASIPRHGAAVLEDPPTILRLRVPGRAGTAIVIDSRNHGIDAPADTSSAPERAWHLSSWLRRAVSVLVEEGLGSWHATAAAQGWGAWRRRHLTHMVSCHAGPRALRLEEDSTHGGRCECLRLGRVGGPVWHLDVRSLYPWCVVGHALPVAALGFEAECTVDRLRALVARHLVIAEVEVTTDEPSYPYRDPVRGITTWPTGTYTACLPGPELQDALSHGRVSRVLRVAWYGGAPVLSAWASHLLSLCERHASDPVLRGWLKALLSGGVGRLGSRDRRWEDRHTDLCCLPYEVFYVLREDGLLDRWRSVAGRTQVEVVGGYTLDAVPAAWAWVCSMGRLRLLQILRCAGWEHVHYCDTDDVMVDRQGRERLDCYGWVAPGRVGYLRPVGEYEWVRLYGIKHYETPAGITVAGLPRAGRLGGAEAPGQWVGIGCKGSLRSARRPTADRRSVPGERAPVYRHGAVGPGGRVTPWVMGGGS